MHVVYTLNFKKNIFGQIMCCTIKKKDVYQIY